MVCQETGSLDLKSLIQWVLKPHFLCGDVGLVCFLRVIMETQILKQDSGQAWDFPIHRP